MRLDLHLTKKYPRFSRSHLQKLIKAGKILVNKKIVTPHYQIKPQDKITENIIPPEKIDPSPDPSIKLNIIYEDKNYLVINKSTGLVVHPSESVKSGTLVNALIAYYPKIKHIRDSLVTSDQLPVANNRPGIVHRLDKDVSGLMVIAKTQLAFNHLKTQFQNHTIKKGYTGLVHGLVKNDSGEINLPIGRSKKGYKMSAHTQPQKTDKPAITKFKVLKRLTPEFIRGDKVLKRINPRIPAKGWSTSGQYSGRYTLLKIQTLTGRTHQIRVHLHAIGHPVVGDPIYKHKNIKIPLQGISRRETQKHKNTRLFLHADLLEFHDLKNQPKKFKLDLPKELKNTLKNLNNK